MIGTGRRLPSIVITRGIRVSETAVSTSITTTPAAPTPTATPRTVRFVSVPCGLLAIKPKAVCRFTVTDMQRHLQSGKGGISCSKNAIKFL